MDWIHCNVCAIRDRNRVKLYLTECQHIVCNNCYAPPNPCPVCEKSSKVMQLSNEMNPDIMQYFTPFPELIRKLFQVYEFQVQQRTRLVQFYVSKYMRLKQAYLQIAQAYRALHSKQNDQFSVQIPSRTEHFSTSTPRFSGNRSDFGASQTSSIRGSHYSGVRSALQNRNSNRRLQGFSGSTMSSLQRKFSSLK